MVKTRIRFLSLILAVTLLLSGCVMDFLTSWDEAYGYYKPTAFKDMEYTRPDLMELQNILDNAHSILQTANSLQEVLNVIYAFNAFYDDFFTNFSLQRGQVMAILPLPRGTRTIWRHLGQSKYR